MKRIFLITFLFAAYCSGFAQTEHRATLSLASWKTWLSLTGTNSGDVTLAGTPNYLSLSGQVLTLSAIDLGSSNASGTLAAARFPALTGDVTTSAGALATTIASGVVTLAKMANMATSSLIYRRTAGTGAPEVNTLAQLKTDFLSTGLDMGSQKITSVTDPTSAQDAATKNYVDNAIANFDSKPLVAYASTSALSANTYNNGSSGVGATLTGNANGPLIIDGVTTITGQVGERVLIAGEATQANNGWYTITQIGVVAISPYILTRATESDQATEIGPGYLTSVIAPNTVTPGSSNNGKVFISVAADPFTVGTTALTFSQVGATYSAGTGLSLSGNTFSLSTPVTVANGGIGVGTLASNAVLYGNGTSAVQALAVNSTGTNKYLQQVSSGAPSWVQIANTDITGLGTLSTQSGTFSGTSSGTNTGDQTITLTGDVTGSGTGSFAATIASNAVTTAKILNSNVTLAKIANIADQTILGNNTGGSAAPVALTAGQTMKVIMPDTTGNTLKHLSVAAGGGYAWAAGGSGTVTSVSGSGGTTGLTLTGGAITTSGTLTLGGTLIVANGGTSLATLTAHSLQVGNGTSAVTQLAVGGTGTLLQGTAATDPAFTATPQLGVASTTTGSLAFYNSGGANAVTFTAPTAPSSALTLQLPGDKGTSNKYLGLRDTSTVAGTVKLAFGGGLITYPPTVTSDSNTTAEDTIIAWSMPANDYGRGDLVHITFVRYIKQNSGSTQTLTIKFYWGSNSVVIANAASVPNSSTLGEATTQIYIQRVGSDIWYTTNTPSSFTSTTDIYVDPTGGKLTSQTFTAATRAAITCKWNVAGGTTFFSPIPETVIITKTCQ